VALDKFFRPQYSDDQRICAEDLELGVAYHRRKLNLHKTSLHGAGIVPGLAKELQVTPTEPPSRALRVLPGAAIDGAGRDLILRESLEVSLDGHWLPGELVYLQIRSHETAEGMWEDRNDPEISGYRRVREAVEITLSASLRPDAIELARVELSAGALRAASSPRPGPGELDLRQRELIPVPGRGVSKAERGPLVEALSSLGSALPAQEAPGLRAATATLQMLLVTRSLDRSGLLAGVEQLSSMLAAEEIPAFKSLSALLAGSETLDLGELASAIRALAQALDETHSAAGDEPLTELRCPLSEIGTRAHSPLALTHEGQLYHRVARLRTEDELDALRHELDITGDPDPTSARLRDAQGRNQEAGGYRYTGQLSCRFAALGSGDLILLRRIDAREPFRTRVSVGELALGEWPLMKRAAGWLLDAFPIPGSAISDASLELRLEGEREGNLFGLDLYQAESL